MKELEAFEAWWIAQETGLGTAHKFTAWNAWLARSAVEADRAQRVPDGKPMFWVRLCSDGMYEGPIHDKQLEDVRRNSGAWSPLYLASTPAPAQQEPSQADGRASGRLLHAAVSARGKDAWAE